jgi:hypothetical protein
MLGAMRGRLATAALRGALMFASNFRGQAWGENDAARRLITFGLAFAKSMSWHGFDVQF